MAKIIVLQHEATQTAGRLGMTLRDHGFKLDIRRPDLDAAQVPADLDDVHGVITLGGAVNISDRPAWLDAELAFLRAAHEAQLPVIGVCLGHQLVAKALGGEVGPMDEPEVGFLPVNLAVPGQTDRILSGQRWSLPQFQCHGQEVTQAPPGATVLGSSERCKVQIFKAGLRTYGFQYHFEMDRDAIERLTREQPHMFEAAGLSADALADQCDAHYASFARLGDRLSLNIATLAFTFDELLSV